ncbi:MAG: exosome complex RNA-binding protein Csl4 [archaeon]|nr:exosome complex RNA-binding protein Csl4 [archaeon]
MDKQELVFPGSFLSFEEEFMAGKNSYSDDDGKVFAESIGYKALDAQTHEASVSSLKDEKKIIQRGSIAICVVSAIKPNAALVEIKQAERDGKSLVVHNSMASISVRNIANNFVESVSDTYRAGDIVRARVMEVTPYGVELETKSPDLGVIKAFGTRSRKPLILIDGKLRDPSTGDSEQRKISSFYMLR